MNIIDKERLEKLEKDISIFKESLSELSRKLSKIERLLALKEEKKQ